MRLPRFRAPLSRLAPTLRPRHKRLQLEPLEQRSMMAVLPSGFTEAAIATGLNNATAMEIAPNGDLWVLEQGGTVKRFTNGSTTADVVGSLSSLGLSSSGERGLLGIAFDPLYSSNQQVYLYYTATTPTTHNRISRFTVNTSDSSDYYFVGTSVTPTDAGSSGTPTQTIIFELDALSSATNHNGGAIHFGPDGMLYAAVGDNATGSNAQTLSNLHGNMLRINKDGSIPSTNPFYNTALNDERAIWALGLRNPFTFSFQAATGQMFINDVGQNTYEEINLGAAGANYGWPGVEGNTGTAPGSPGTYRGPLYIYSHGSGEFQGYAITGGAFYHSGTSQFPASYANDYFFADYGNSWINVRDSQTGAVSKFASNAPATVDLRVATNGSLYYLARGANSVYAVQYTASQAPNITQEPTGKTISVGANTSFSVTATGTAPLAYQWQKLVGSTWTNVTNGGRFSGATLATLLITGAQAADAGQYRAIVSNSSGSDTSNAATLAVTTNQAPSASIAINSGLTGGKFIAGQAIGFSGTATDTEDGTLPASRYTWQVDYITSINSGTPIVRPFVPAFSGQTSGTFTPATTGPYTLTDVAYRVTLTVTDSAGQSRTITQDILPNTATLTVGTNPGGLQVTVDGQPFASPRTFSSVVGFQRPIGAAATQTVGGVTYTFQSWSDGGSATHSIVTPANNIVYTASYKANTAATPIKIDFQPSNLPIIAGYNADSGQVYGSRGNGLTYGWNATNNSARNRNSSRSPDERYDTIIHMQKSPNSNARWDVAVPNGTYSVRIVAGDSRYTDSYFRINVEGVRAIDSRPTSSRRWIDNTVTVTVNDGRLTVSNASGAVNNKLAFLEITPITVATFQSRSAIGYSEAIATTSNVDRTSFARLQSAAAVATPTLSIADGSVVEGGRASVVVTLSDASSKTVYVSYSTGYASAGSSDLTRSSGTLTFRPGQRQKTIAVNIKQDSLVEGNETFTVIISNARNAIIGNGSATITISDDDQSVPPPPTSTAPTAPSGLIATALSDTQIRLNWTDTSSNETGFRIERSPNGTTGWAQVGSVVAGVTTLTNSGLAASTQYHYRVRAVNTAGYSAYTAVVSAQTAATVVVPPPNPNPTPTNNAKLLYSNPLTSLSDLAKVHTVTAWGDSTKANGEEQQFYLDYNAVGGVQKYPVFAIADGGLQINAIRASGLPAPEYPSDMPNNFISGAFTLDQMLYGYISVDMKFTSRLGQWGAFWLTEPGAPKGTSEIDVAEQWAETDDFGTIASNLLKFGEDWDAPTLFDMNRDTDVDRVVMSPSGAQQWHNYALEWTPSAISVYVDGVRKWTYDPPVGFDKAMVPMFNLATIGSEGSMGVRNIQVYDKKPVY